mgnify:CR=1 FL=1
MFAKIISAFLKGVLRAVGIVFSRRGLAEHAAQIDEMLLAGGALGKLDAGPLGDEPRGGEIAGTGRGGRGHGGIIGGRGTPAKRGWIEPILQLIRNPPAASPAGFDLAHSPPALNQVPATGMVSG